MSPLDLARPDLLALQGYSSARMEAGGGHVMLNANERPWPQDRSAPLNRYPDPQPQRLRALMADVYGVSDSQILIGRGSDEMIDLLVRGFCRAGQDAILIQPPTFGMYAVCAAVQGARVCSVPLVGPQFMPDIEGVLATVETSPVEAPVKLVFACTPNNPTGAAGARSDLLQLAHSLQGRSLLVVDEAYVEFADDGSLAGDVATNDNLVVLRTLSKVHGLAAARIGCMVAAPDVVAFLRRIMPPYPIPAPCSDAAERALSPISLQHTRQRMVTLLRERDRMRERLSRHPAVREVLASQANFLCVRFDDAGLRYAQLVAGGVVVRDLRRYAGLGDALRISIGTPQENDTLLATLDAHAACPA